MKAILCLTALLMCNVPQAVSAWGFKGHRIVGSIADAMLKDEARWLRDAGPWTDCVKSVAKQPDGSFKYLPAKDIYRIACAGFETPAEQARMEDYVGRNWSNCTYEPSPGTVKGCHETYHFDDVAVQRRAFDSSFKGTNAHDLVNAVGAAIAVLKGLPPPAPFSITDKKEAILLLAHFIGDLHQPLHVGSVYVDANDARVDPDKAGAIDPDTENAGGNAITGPAGNLHSEWDAVPAELGEDATESVMRDATATAPVAGPIETWPAVWANESVAEADALFISASFKSTGSKHWSVTFADRDAYMRYQDLTKRRQLGKAGARLAQILNEVLK